MNKHFKLKNSLCDATDISEYSDFSRVKMCGKEIKNFKKIMALQFKVSINIASGVVL